MSFSLGFSDTPSFQEGFSPFTAKVDLIVSTDVNSYEVDFLDGTIVKGDFVKDAEYGRASLTHIYTYEQESSKYRGHTFYPKITIYGERVDSGEQVTNVFNTAETGRSLSIVVTDAKYKE